MYAILRAGFGPQLFHSKVKYFPTTMIGCFRQSEYLKIGVILMGVTSRAIVVTWSQEK
jgi:hypothetical protein